jgi:prevent-host-death family protein
MKVYTYSEARQKFSTVLDIAKSEDVIIKRRGGERISIKGCRTWRFK